MALDLGASAFAFQSSTHRAVRGPGLSPGHRGNDGVTQDADEALPCRSSVLSLGPVLRGADGESGACSAVSQPLEDACALDFVQSGGGAQIQTELYTRVGGVDALTTGSGGAGELLEQFLLRHPESMGCTGARWHVQVIHVTSLPQSGTRAGGGCPPGEGCWRCPRRGRSVAAHWAL